jgi:hypothetical protein
MAIPMLQSMCASARQRASPVCRVIGQPAARDAWPDRMRENDVSYRFIKLFVSTTFALLFSWQAHAANPVPVKLAEVVRSQLYIPMYVALSKGFAAAEGLDVELVTANGGDRAGALVLSGQADFALAGPEVAIYIYNGESSDKPLIFCALTATDGFYLVSRTKLDKFDWSMLNNKKIIGFRPGSTPELYLQYVMKQRGVDPATISNVVTNIGVPARDGAWISGAGDFGIFMEPNLSKLEKVGEAHVITSIGKEVGRADYTVFFAKRSCQGPGLGCYGEREGYRRGDRPLFSWTQPRRKHCCREPLSGSRCATLGIEPRCRQGRAVQGTGNHGSGWRSASRQDCALRRDCDHNLR